MKNILTRSELLKAQNAFDCKEWKEIIQEILDSTNEKEIFIQDKYLDLIKLYATWTQIKYCKALNLDLKMNLPVEAKEWILEKLKGCEVVKYGYEYNNFSTFYKEKGKIVFVLKSKYEEFWFDSDRIFQVLRSKYSLKYNEIKELINSISEEHLKLKDYTPIIDDKYFCFELEECLKIYGYTKLII